MKIADLAANPPPEYRPVPFWSWNDRLENKELSRQIKAMYEAGIGGFFMHARGGLLTEYLGEEWFSATKNCIHDAERLGMKAWAYDENGWPSGFGNGLVNALGVKYQQKYLRCEKSSGGAFREYANLIALYSPEGKRISEEFAASLPEVLLCRYDVNPYYVDTLDLAVTEEFLKSVHQKYYDTLDNAERAAMSGFFTDEPQISRNGIPWSFVLENEYRKAYGEELLDVLPQLLLDLEGCERTRYRFWRLVTRLFMNHFLKPIHEWCSAHGWKLTGHQVCEDNYLSQLTSNGAVMPQYQYYHIPGMDALGRNFTSLATPLQLASAAAQCGQRQILSETFALCGWGVSFADLKWLCQWQMVHGINLICQHLEGYSLRGIRKRDYPASLFLHQPWWKYYRMFNDAVSRIGVLLANGSIQTEVLLLHAITTAHILYNTRTSEKIMRYSHAFESLSQLLADLHIDHHYGDETLMEQYGSTDGAVLKIGTQSYKLVILPKLLNLSSKQLELLEKFASAGGVILAERNDEDSGFFVDGIRTDNLPLLDQIEFFDSPEALADRALAQTGTLSVVRKDTPPERCFQQTEQIPAIHATRRFFDDFDGRSAVLYYYVNTRRFESFETTIFLSGEGVERFDPESGRVEPVCFSKESNGMLRIEHRFEAAGDLLLLVRNEKVSSAPLPEKKERKKLYLPQRFEIARCSENMLTLEFCRCEIDGKLLFSREYVLTIQDELLKRRCDLPVKLTFDFLVGESYPLGQTLSLLLEHPERYEIHVNGVRISNCSNGFFADQAFERVEIGSAVIHGKNTIELELTFHQDPEVYAGIDASKIFESEKNKLSFQTEIEAVYLCGKFGVATDGIFLPLERNAVRYQGTFRLEALPESVDIEHIEASGFPFFAGSITLRQYFDLEKGREGEKTVVGFRNLFAHAASIRINGTEIGVMVRPDYILPIPDGVLKAGKNILEIKLTNSLRNMLGPLHLEEGECLGVSPGTFYKDPGVFAPWTPVVWNKDFCFLRFGAERFL